MSQRLSVVTHTSMHALTRTCTALMAVESDTAHDAADDRRTAWPRRRVRHTVLTLHDTLISNICFRFRESRHADRKNMVKCNIITTVVVHWEEKKKFLIDFIKHQQFPESLLYRADFLVFIVVHFNVTF